MHRMRDEGSPPDRVIANVAARQHGVVTAAQLDAAGIHRSGLTRRVEAGRLHRVHRGVYAVGHRGLSPEGAWMAAVLACGRAAVLSHRSAAALWALLPAHGTTIDVAVPHSVRLRPRRGIRIHRSRTLSVELTTCKSGVPVTTPARTIADLRNLITPGQQRRALREAEALGLDAGDELEADHTRSELEHRFLRLCRRHHLPMPEVNVALDRFTVDFLWRKRRLIVETDGYRYHRGRQAFEDDRRRDAELRLLGYEVVRFTYRQVLDDPRRLAEVMRTVLNETPNPVGVRPRE